MVEAGTDLKQARALLAHKAYKQAHAICMAHLQQSPQSPEPYLLLGVLALDHDNFQQALELFDRCLDLGGAEDEAHAQAARCYLALSLKEKAYDRIKLAILASENSSALVLDTIGVVLSRIGRHDEAIDFYRRATRVQPDVSSYQYNLGAALQFKGAFDDALIAFDRCLELDPEDMRARIGRATIAKQTEEKNDLEALSRAWETIEQADALASNADSCLQISHAMAKIHEDLGQPLQAMSALSRGKALKLLTVTDREADDAAIFNAAQELAESLPVPKKTESGGPVFVVGMPRTGTTMVDRILTSHPEISSAGELSDFSIALKRTVRTPGDHVLDEASLRASLETDLRSVGQRYISNVRQTLGLDGRFTDKMPLNFFFVPAILAALPDARVVCLRRHPADTVLSNYRQLFATSFSYYAYAYDLEQTARYTVNFNRLLSCFEAQLPAERFMIVDYEQIVCEQESETRRLLEFAGLSWDPACLAFHKNESAVATASSVQVRAPIYKSSMNRWKRYRPAIDPALDILLKAELIRREEI